MKKLEVLVNSWADETQVLQKTMSEAQGVGSEFGSEIVKDANGKLVKVILSFNENANLNGLATAKANINKDPGVSTTVTFPLGGTIDALDDLGSGGTSVNAQVLDIGGIKAVPTIFSPSSEWQAAFTADAKSGAGALMLADKDNSDNRLRGSLNVSAALNGFSLIKDYSIKGFFNIKDTLNGVTKDKGSETSRGTLAQISVPGIGSLQWNPQGFGNQNAFVNIRGESDFVDSGSSYINNYLDFEFKKSLGGALVEIFIGGSLLRSSNVTPRLDTEVSIFTSLQDDYSGGNGDQRPLLLDDLNITIEDGVA